MALDTSLAGKLAEPFILALLEREPMHPYALLKAIEETFGQEPAKGRIYQLMKRLEAEGFVATAEVEEAGTKRSTYALTDAGREALARFRTKPLKFYDFLEHLWGMKKPVTIGAGAPPRAKGALEEVAARLAGFRGRSRVTVSRDYAEDRLTVTVDGLEALSADRERTARLLAALDLIAGATLP